jgi:long-chain fatty acid transport protein
MRSRSRKCLIASIVFLSGVPVAWGQGIIVPSAGPINSSMAGASTAAPVDFGGSYWNPAILSALEDQEFLLGSALALPSTHLQSSLEAGSIGGIFPPTNRFGESRSDSGVASGLATGFSFRLADDSPLTLGLGIFGLVGGGVNFAGSYTTPILTPRQPPLYFGVGPIFSSMSILSINPMASLQLTDRLAVGLGPIITSGSISFNPAFFAPEPKGVLGLPTFPPATNARPYWGGGFQVGLFYELSDNWNTGFSYKSPIWQEKWDFNSTYSNLAPRRIGIQASLPEIFSWGIAYKGIPKTLVALDLRYIDYANSELFGQKVIDGGLGWRSVFVVALGTQYRATDRLTLRAGYLYNTNPIPNPVTLFNVQAPGIITNTFTMGASYDVTPDVTFSLAWMHGFRNSIEGPILQIPGSSVRLDTQLDVIWAGVNVKFGGSRRKGPAGATTTDTVDLTPPASWSGPYVPTPPASSGTDVPPPTVPTAPENPPEAGYSSTAPPGVADPAPPANPQSP